ncbi:MAG TPA: FHA domain-containing protein [Pyrinomonadaceae bacterium]|nr:FHA domain-containing protein [Pyrinomonadaceae bacterium]
MSSGNRFIVVREDLLQDPVTIISEGLLIGRLRQCELLLNHPSVSRVQAGIKEIDDDYYVFSLRESNPPILNGKPVSGNEALAPGDVLDIGPFRLEFDVADDDVLSIAVTLQIGVEATAKSTDSAELATTALLSLEALPGKKATKPRPAPIGENKALDIFWDKRIREAGKMVRRSPLFPRSQRKSGKAQFNWIPTSDLASRWPIAFFVWSGLVVAILAGIAAIFYTNIYAPAPLAYAHAKPQLEQVPAVATRANAAECTSCHSLSASMEARCAACHNTEAFVATVIEPHAQAAIGCVSCHDEHNGVEFRAARAALETCSNCHNDANHEMYNGRKVGTPHAGSFGYPVVDGRWKWRGLSDDDWKSKEIAVTRLPEDTDEQWRSKQFHAVHLYRVRSIGNLSANADGQLSCSSCHKNFNPIDRETPRSTCATCHNGKLEPGSNQVLIASNEPNCTSCHVQHVRSKRHWNPSLLAMK